MSCPHTPGASGSILTWQPPGPEPRCLKEYDAFYFFQKFCGKVRSGKKSEVGCEEILSLFFSRCAPLQVPVVGGSHHVPHSIPHRWLGMDAAASRGYVLGRFTSATARSRAGFRVTLHNRGRLGQRGLPEGNLAPV